MKISLRRFLESNFGPLSEREWDWIEEHVEPLPLGKNEDVHSIGKYCRHLWFLQKGAVRGYEWINGEEKSTMFFVEDSFFIDYQSILMQTPSEMGFKTVEDSLLLQFPHSKLAELYDQFPAFERMTRILLERQLMQEYELRKLQLHLDAFERYNYLLEHSPYIFQRFALKDIASFIGITPVSLSRLRKMK